MPFVKKPGNYIPQITASDFQWQANPSPDWRMKYNLQYRHYAVLLNDSAVNLWGFPAMYLQKIPAESFISTTKINFSSLQKGERAGFIIMGKSYAALELLNTGNGLQLNYVTCSDADKKSSELSIPMLANVPSTIYFRIKMDVGAVASFSYSIDGINFQNTDVKFKAISGVWVGAKMGFYCTSNRITNDAGFMEVRSFNTQK
jgi:hypothetical protein